MSRKIFYAILLPTGLSTGQDIGMGVISLPAGGHGHLTEDVAAEVRALMGRYSVTQTMLGDVLGIAQSAVSERLKGKRAFSLDEIERLADYFGLAHPAELLGGQPPSPRPGPGTGLPARGDWRAWRDSNSQPSDPKVRPIGAAA